MKQIPLLKGVTRIHFIGIGGSGMFPLVQIMHGFGYTITGSDVNEGSIIDSLRGMGISVTIPHSGSCVEGADMVVYTAALLPGNVEMTAAQTLSIKQVPRSELLGAVCALYEQSFCIAGTHGKTTATAMTTQALLTAGVDTAAVIGGRLPLIDGYGRHGAAGTITIEACEYANTFLQLRPSVAVLLNVDEDHLDFFGSFDNLKRAFRDFLSLAQKAIVINGDDDCSVEVAQGIKTPQLTFGTKPHCDVRAENIRREDSGFYSFDVHYDARQQGRVTLGVPGYHNIYNALATLACCHLQKADFEGAKRGIGEFRGAGRRFEILGEVDGVTVADDYAHHPTEVDATIAAARELPYKRVIVIHQPFTYSRTRTLLKEFAEALSGADVVLLTEIMAGREEDPGDIKSAQLAQLLAGCKVYEGFEGVVRAAKDMAKPGDLIVTMGCGDIYKAAKILLSQL